MCDHKYVDTKVTKQISKTATYLDRYGRTYKEITKYIIQQCVRCYKTKRKKINTWTTRTLPMTRFERKYWEIRRT